MEAAFRLVLATRNPGKIAEIQHLLADIRLDIIDAASIGAPEVEEKFPTLEDNALEKARALYRFSGSPALADDTGLEVDALGGRPGVYSARFAGTGATDAANRGKLLAQLESRRNRAARFRTVVAYVDGDFERVLEGVCEGEIIAEERGDGGFGYDSIFVPIGSQRTFAEMSSQEKNTISHRGKAVRLAAEFIRERFATRTAQST